jgi:hypothetical protein
MSWLKWQDRLRGEKVLTYPQPDEEDEGYYRTLITETGINAKNGQRNGKTIPVMWGKPVAYYMLGSHLIGAIGDRDMTENEVNDLWTYVCRYPISEDLYRDVAEKGKPWPDLPPKAVAEVPAADRDVTTTDNAPAEAIALDVEHATAIDNAIGAGKDLPVTTVAEAAVASGAANIIRDRRLAAEKAAKRVVDPLKVAYEDERDKWLKSVKRAKDVEAAIRLRVSNFEIDERRRIAAEQLAALEKQREIDEANSRAADRAISRGEPEAPPEVEEVVIPQAPERVRPTYGTYTPREKPILKFAVIEDAAAVLNHFKLHADVIELIQKLATSEIRSGLTVPGATYREGLV